MKSLITCVTVFAATLGLTVTIYSQIGPDKVVTNLYKAAKTKRPANMSKTELRRFFDRELSDLIWNAAHDESGLDFDILYNAQDTQIRNFRITKAQPQTAAVSFWNVSFTNFGRKESITFELANPNNKGWRVTEVTYQDGSELSKILAPN